MEPKQLRWKGRPRPWRAAFQVVLALAVSSDAFAQRYARLDLGWSIEVGGESERYARAMQLAGFARPASWSIQPFTPTQIVAMHPTRAHPWRAQFDADTSAPAASFEVLRPSARLIGNSSYPFQISGGPTWAGRGLTGDVQAGVAGNWRRVFGELAPLAFVAQNAAFPLAPNGQTGNLAFADPRFPYAIDVPQRFGSQAYSRLDLGTSSLAVDAFGGFVALSSAPQRWGPMPGFPLVLGPNGGGFPSLLLGTSAPVDLWLFKLHTRVLYGELGQSPYASTPDERRLASGLVVAAQPRGLPGLELGATRFIERPWGQLSSDVLARPFSGIISSGATKGVNEAYENQVASVFGRWQPPGSRSEFYGELYKEDYPGGFHSGMGNLVESPDDLASFSLGFQRVLRGDSSIVRIVRAEIVNGLTSHQQRLERGFTVPLPPYVHGGVVQGHTVNGLFLGSAEAYGGSGWEIGVDEFSERGRRSLTFQRALRLDWLPVTESSGQVHPDVVYALRADAARFVGRRTIGLTIIPSVDLNRDLVARHDVFNLTVALSWRGR